MAIVGAAVFFFPSLTARFINNPETARAIGVAIVICSLVLVNFRFYRRSNVAERVTKDDLLLYPHHNRPHNSVQVHFVGPEKAKDVGWWVIYEDAAGEMVQEPVTQSFAWSDRTMWVGDIHDVRTLDPNDRYRFNIPSKKSTSTGELRVKVEFTGATSGRRVTVEKDFELQY